ncbi:hypothetical protein MY3296_009127 [Beauveria thailandica]
MQVTSLFTMLPSIDPLECISGFATYAILLFGSFNALRLVHWLCIGIQASELNLDLLYQVSSYLHIHIIILALGYIGSLCLVIFGFRSYLIVQSQWCWGSILVMSIIPALTAYSIARAINDEDLRRDTLRKCAPYTNSNTVLMPYWVKWWWQSRREEVLSEEWSENMTIMDMEELLQDSGLASVDLDRDATDTYHLHL